MVSPIVGVSGSDTVRLGGGVRIKSTLREVGELVLTIKTSVLKNYIR